MVPRELIYSIYEAFKESITGNQGLGGMLNQGLLTIQLNLQNVKLGQPILSNVIKALKVNQDFECWLPTAINEKHNPTKQYIYTHTCIYITIWLHFKAS